MIKMLFFSTNRKTLKEIVFQKHLSIRADELNVLCGYISSTIIQDLKELDLKVKIVYGLARQEKLNDASYKDLCDLNTGNISIYCPEILSHAKLYIWKYKGSIVYVLNGSANFSSKGLRTPHMEVLSEVSHTSFSEFEDYFNLIFDSSVPINKIDLDRFGSTPRPQFTDSNDNVIDPQFCETDSLFARASKINWGHGNAHTNPRDAYIPIRVRDITNYPNLFPEKSSNQGLRFHDNAPIDILWDDGERMEGLLEGSTIIDGLRYPNKISSFKSKKIMGDYLRKRLSLKEGEFVTKQVFQNYGRDNITISLISEGVYFMDFSV
ncbi:MAG: hypothetical protein CL847_05550 [Crocinitomicaceae bacterium]|nr:hypothetical protein [Crocinitomicaceae bacterium]|tara:strand:- start:547 stop:1512 length:966 start_codon:yes stop_codon:yes gene_type:complete